MEESDWHPSYPQSQRPMSMPANYDATQSQPSPLAHPMTTTTSAASRLYKYNNKSSASSIMPRSAAARTMQPSAASMPIPIPANPSVIPGNLLPSAPASPPTPAPSPTPGQRAPNWSTANEHEDIGLEGSIESDDDGVGSTGTYRGGASARASAARSSGVGLGYRHMRGMFADMDNEERKRMLAELLNMCDGKLLGWVNGFVAPRLKRDPFGVLPNELCLRVGFVLFLFPLHLSPSFDFTLFPFVASWLMLTCLSLPDSHFHRRRKNTSTIVSSLSKMARASQRRYGVEEPLREARLPSHV